MATAGVNYEYLFNVANPGLDSLFNLNNLKALVDAGLSTPNICTDNTQTYGTTFTLDSKWTALS